jgi:hypothetical protein
MTALRKASLFLMLPFVVFFSLGFFVFDMHAGEAAYVAFMLPLFMAAAAAKFIVLPMLLVLSFALFYIKALDVLDQARSFLPIASAILLARTEKYHAIAIKTFKLVLGVTLISILLYIIIIAPCCILAAFLLIGLGSGQGRAGRHEGAGSVGAAG